jgi:hypothetical protein
MIGPANNPITEKNTIGEERSRIQAKDTGTANQWKLKLLSHGLTEMGSVQEHEI